MEIHIEVAPTHDEVTNVQLFSPAEAKKWKRHKTIWLQFAVAEFTFLVNENESLHTICRVKIK